MKQKISKQTKVVKKEEDFISNEIDEEIILMNLKSGSYFGLNEIASLIWREMDETSTFDDLVKRLVNEFDVEPTECEKDVAELLEKLYDEKLIELINE